MDLKQINEAFTAYLRPQTCPVAIKMCQAESELPDKVKFPIKDLGINIALCHAVAMSRRYGWTMAIDKFASCYYASLSMGFVPLLPDVVDGSYQASLGLWGMTKEQHAAMLQNTSKFGYGKYKYVLMAPLDRANFAPDVILFYGNPAQVWVLLAAYLMSTGKSGLPVTLNWGAGCTAYITKALLMNECQFTLLGAGERLITHPQDTECAFSVPMSHIEKVVKGFDVAYKGGAVRYPVPSYLRYASQHPAGYDKMRTHLLGEDK